MVGQRDVFIAHAYQDKAEYVRPLATALGRRAVSCWIDEAQIGPGDSLIDAMNEGLKGSEYIVVVVTQRFLSARWAPRELNAALQLEVQAGKTKVVPVVAVEHDMLSSYPLLLDKRYLSWSLGVDEVSAEIAALFDRRPHAEWFVDPPQSYVGPAWMRANAVPPHVGRAHAFVLRWGPFTRPLSVPALGPAPISFLFHKTHQDRITLHVEARPEAILTFGFGAPPDQSPEIIDEGWERAAGWNFPELAIEPADPTAVQEQLRVTAGGPPQSSTATVFHLRLSRMFRNAEAFNLGGDELETYVEAWRTGRPVFLKGRRWDPSNTRISIYQGPRLTTNQRALGLGWNKVTEFGEDVTDLVLRS